jgi:histidine triad (HIT) family protein
VDDLRTDGYGLEDRRKHLDMVQAVVARLAGASAVTKGWQLPVVTAAYGYAVAQQAWRVAIVGVGLTLLLASVDARYLRQERANRALFRGVARGVVRDYDMDVDPYLGRSDGDATGGRDEDSTWRGVLTSGSIGWFYGPVLAAGVLAAVTAAAAH